MSSRISHKSRTNQTTKYCGDAVGVLGYERKVAMFKTSPRLRGLFHEKSDIMSTSYYEYIDEYVGEGKVVEVCNLLRKVMG